MAGLCAGKGAVENDWLLWVLQQHVLCLLYGYRVLCTIFLTEALSHAYLRSRMGHDIFKRIGCFQKILELLLCFKRTLFSFVLRVSN